MPEARIQPYSPPIKSPVCEYLQGEFSMQPFAMSLSAGAFCERVTSKPLFGEAICLAAFLGDRVAGCIVASPRPAADYEGPDRSCGVVNLLLFDRDRPEAGDLLLEHTLEGFRRFGAVSAEAMTASGGYPFFRGVFCGSEPGLHESLDHVAAAFERARFGVRGELALLGRSLVDLGMPSTVPAGIEVEDRELPVTSSWGRQSWAGMKPRQCVLSHGRERLGRIVWSPLPGARPTSGEGGVGGVGAIAELSVRSDRRGEGLGRLLIESALAAMGAAGATEAVVTAEADSAAAMGAYRSAGFEKVADMANFRRLLL